MKKNTFEKILILFLMLQPILDCITAWQLRNNSNLFSIGTILRGLFFLFLLGYLYFKKWNRKSIYLFFIYGICMLFYEYSFTENNFYKEAFNLFKIFYLPFLIYFFSSYKSEKINDKLITILYFIYLNLIIIPYYLSIGYSSYEPGATKIGYIGLFYGGNEISAILIGLLPIVLNYIKNQKNRGLKILFLVEIILATVIIGTKAMFLGILLVFGYFLFHYLKKMIQTNPHKLKKYLFIPLPFIILIALIFPKLPVYNNLLISLNYYQVHKWTDLLNIKNIDNIVFSTRLSYLENIHHVYQEQNGTVKLLGLGDSLVFSIKDVEIDFFDIFYKIGIMGFLLWLFFMVDASRKKKLHGVYQFSFFLFFLISMFSGHILLKPMVSLFVALVFILDKEECLNFPIKKEGKKNVKK